MPKRKAFSELFTLEYEQSVQFGEYNKKLIRTYWYICYAVTIGALVIWGISVGTGEYEISIYKDTSYTDYLLRFMVYPFIGMSCCIIPMWLLSKPLIKRGMFALQAYTNLFFLTILATVIVYAHYAIAGIYFTYVFAVFTSLIYIDRKPVIFAGIWSMLNYVAVSALLLDPLAADGTIKHGIGDKVVTILFIIAAIFVSNYILERKRLLVDSVIDERKRSKLDSLTKLCNHAAFYETLDERILEYKENGEPLSIIIWDIDNFKKVNDTYGHAMGDTILLKLVEAIKAMPQEQGTGFRYGGEEFAFITNEDANGAFAIAERVRAKFKECGETVSGGICQYAGGSRKDFFSAADEALYKAKHSGKDRTVIYKPESAKGYL